MRQEYLPQRTQRAHRCLCVCVAAVVWLLFVSAVGAQGGDQPVSLNEYRARLDQVIRELETAPAGGAAAAVTQTHQELGTRIVVTLQSGDTIAVQSPLSASLSRDEALARLHWLRDQLAAAANDNTVVRQARLRAILERPEFAGRSSTPSLLQRALNWLRDQLPDDLLGLPGSVTSAVGAVVVIAGLVFVAILLSYWLQGFLRGFVTNAEARRRQEEGRDGPLTAAAARQQATALAQAGSYRQAMRQLYLAALLRLDEVGALRYDRSQTNREVLSQLPATSPTHSHLAPVVDTFDRIWYGVREPDLQTYDRYAAEVDWLTTAVEPPGDERPGGES